MTFSKISRYFSSVLIFVAAGCLDPYTPPTNDVQRNFLVVDGFVNTGNKSAEVKLSMAVPLSAGSTSNPVSAAGVYLEESDGTIIPLFETSTKGTYSAQQIEVENGKKYVLRINIGENQYISDEVEMKRSPVLDSVTWQAGSTGVTIYVDSHDVTGSTKYYQWNFIETWEYNSEFFSQFIWDRASLTPIQRHDGQYNYVCYGTQSSTRVLISSTTSNSLDVVNDFPLAFIPKGSKKLMRLYSILVQQRAMDEQAYTFWKNIQRSTESVGGLFDAMPSEITGNVHNMKNPSEKILGYFTGGEVQEKRIFIDWDELPLDLHVVEKNQCAVDSILVGNLSLYGNVDLYLVHAWGAPATIGYIASSGICVDCTLSGGVLEKPSFWPQ